MGKQIKKPESCTKIHNVRFYNLLPRAIQCLAFNKIWNKVAVGRNNGNIEVWDMEFAPCLEKTIYSVSPVETVVWAGKRLFSAGISGKIREWDLQTLQLRREQFVTGNAIWCLDVNPLGTELAIGTEEGYINIFDIEDDNLQYKHIFDKQGDRVLCCKFDSTGNFVVSGSMGVIRIWDNRSGHAVKKMTLPRVDNHKECIVWTLQVLRDLTIISGDSRGQLTIWDGRNATRIDVHQVLKADILSVAVNDEESMIICSGIEPIIRIYAKTIIKREDMAFTKWVRFLQRNVHDHDVKTLQFAGERILSGGIDGYLGVSSVSKMTSQIVKYGPFLQGPCVTICSQKKLLLLRYPNYLEIWRLGSTSGNEALLTTEEIAEIKKSNEIHHSSHRHRLLALDSMPEKLLELRSKNDECIVCATLSPDSQWLCYSTQNEFRMFKFIPSGIGNNKNATQITRVKERLEHITIASHIKFTHDSKKFYLVDQVNKKVLMFKRHNNSEGEWRFANEIDCEKHLKDSISLLTISRDNTYIAIADVCNTVAVWRLNESKNYEYLLNLPRYNAATTAIAIHPLESRIVATYSDGRIIEYDLEEMCFKCCVQNEFVQNASTHCILNIALDIRNPEIFILHNDTNLFVLEKYKKSNSVNEDNIKNELSNIRPRKSKRLSENDEKSAKYALRLKMQKTYEHFIHLDWLNTEELIAVGVNPLTLIEQLPDAFKQKKFGTM